MEILICRQDPIYREKKNEFEHWLSETGKLEPERHLEKEKKQEKQCLPSMWQRYYGQIHLTVLDWENFKESLANYCEKQEKPLLLASTNEMIETGLEMGLPCLGIEDRENLSCSYLTLDFFQLSTDYLYRIWARQAGFPVFAFETRKCLVREIRLEDLDELYRIYQEEKVQKFMEPLFPREEEEDYTKAYLANIYPFYDFGMWIVEDQETGDIIGRVGADPRVFDEDEMEPELGYLIRKSYEGRGLATDLCRGVISYLKENTDCRRVNALVEGDNPASIRVVEKLGFHYLKEHTASGRNYLRYVLELME